MTNAYITIFVTCPSIKSARKIVNALLKERLIACGNIISGVESHFWWKNKVDKAKECLIIAKSRRVKFEMIRKRIERLHSYEVPEIIALPILFGNKAYLKWIDEAVKI